MMIIYFKRAGRPIQVIRKKVNFDYQANFLEILTTTELRIEKLW